MRSPSNADGQEVVAYQARLDDEKEHNVAILWSRPRPLVNFGVIRSNINECGETRKKDVACDARYMDAHNTEQPTLRIHRHMREAHRRAYLGGDDDLAVPVLCPFGSPISLSSSEPSSCRSAPSVSVV